MNAKPYGRLAALVLFVALLHGALLKSGLPHRPTPAAYSGWTLRLLAPSDGDSGPGRGEVAPTPRLAALAQPLPLAQIQPPTQPARQSDAAAGTPEANKRADTDKQPTPGTAAPAQALADSPAPTPSPDGAARSSPRPPPPSDRGSAATALAANAVVAPSARLRYTVQAQSKGLTVPAQAELVWRREGLHYEARWSVQAFLLGSRVQTSQGDVGPQGLLPLRFAEKNRSELAAHFERGEGRIRFSANTPDAPLLAGTQDRLSVLLQLGALLAAAPHPASGSEITLPTVGARELDNWTFVVGGVSPLHLPAGDFDGQKLERRPQRAFDVQVELWLAPSLHYLPVRLRLTQSNGDVVDQQLSSIEMP